jgi:formiminotetrahydrofolate cyclodeaminase
MYRGLSIEDFAKKVACHQAVVPAGGSVIALSGLMGVCLLEMSVESAYARPGGEQHSELFNKARKQLAMLHDELLAYIGKDAEAYSGVLAAFKMHKSTQEEIEHRTAEIQSAVSSAIEIPLKISEACLAALDSGILLQPKIKHAAIGDLKIGLMVIRTSIEGSMAAARINLSLIQDAALVRTFQARIDEQQVRFKTLMTSLL